jgi:hypothetical protein
MRGGIDGIDGIDGMDGARGSTTGGMLVTEFTRVVSHTVLGVTSTRSVCIASGSSLSSRGVKG